MASIQGGEGPMCENDVTHNGPTSSISPLFHGTYEEKLRHGFENVKLSDYDLRVFLKPGKIRGIHKTLFVASSTQFLELFKRSTAQNNGMRSVKIDMDEDVFRVIKTFLYSERFPSGMTTDLALRVLESSIQYGIRKLQSLVLREVACLMTTAGDKLNVLATARCLELKELEALALERIFENAEDVLEHDDFPKLGLYDVQNILTSNSLNCKESVVFKAAVRWASKKATNSEDNASAFKYYFREVIQFIRFTLMTPMELAELSLSYKDAMDIIGREGLLQLFKLVSLPVYMRGSISTGFNTTPRSYVDIKCTQKVSRNNSVGTQTSPIDDNNQLSGTASVSTSGVTISMPPPSLSLVGSSGKAILAGRKRLYPESEVSFATTVSTPDSFVREKKTVRISENPESDEELFVRRCAIESRTFHVYEDMIRKYYREDDKTELGSFYFKNITITDNYRPLIVKYCTDVSIDASLSFLARGKEDREESFLQFVKHFDPMRYLVFNNKAPNPLTVGNLWTLNQNFMLKFSGITFLKMCHKNSEVVLNYMNESRTILSNEKMRLRKLAVSNSEFSWKMLKEKGKLEELILYRAWGEFTLEEIINDCPNLSKLVCWKHVPTSWIKGSSTSIPLCLKISPSLLAKTSLRKLVLFQAELKLPGTTRIQSGTSISELYLDHCHTKNNERAASVFEVFCKVFPQLKTLTIFEDLSLFPAEIRGNIASSELINSIRKNVASIEWIRVAGLKWSSHSSSEDSPNHSYDRIEDEDLNEFLTQSGLPNQPTNFLLERNETWKGTSKEDPAKEPVDLDGGYWSSMDEMEFTWYELNNFYDNCEIFEDYFVQDPPPKLDKKRSGRNDDVFPRSVLWL
ncbi:unnamed protein product [Orchesella dallaii]|uniref:BTB domain-containing protein n=1 Tax=Orchesella dallaii TaxID=48710 RepID=A0ABP1QXQ1_9HEXA